MLLAVLGLSPGRQRADHSARAAVSALGRDARRAGRHRRAGRGDLARRVAGARRGRAQRGGRAGDRGGRAGAALSECPHPVLRRHRRADLRRGHRGASSRCACCKPSALRASASCSRTRSRNTVENALFSKEIAQPKPGERWLLVTSAYHLPRAIGVFRKAGFAVEAYPVDWRTRGSEDVAAAVLHRGRWTAANRHRRARMGRARWSIGSPAIRPNCFRGRSARPLKRISLSSRRAVAGVGRSIAAVHALIAAKICGVDAKNLSVCRFATVCSCRHGRFATQLPSCAKLSLHAVSIKARNCAMPVDIRPAMPVALPQATRTRRDRWLGSLMPASRRRPRLAAAVAVMVVAVSAVMLGLT